MVSTWRFWSGKEINFGTRQPFQLLVVLAILIFVLVRFSSGALFFVALAYMFSGIWARAAYGWSRRRRRIPPGEPDEIPARSATQFTADYAQEGSPEQGATAAEQEWAQMHDHPATGNVRRDDF
jgi:hypothetical protein